MTDQPRRRAQVNGLYVIFESRDPKLATVRWHPRFKLRYRTKADALAAKQAWEERGRIMFPGDFGKPKKPAAKSEPARRYRETQLEARV
jgi:hypothetical protein